MRVVGIRLLPSPSDPQYRQAVSLPFLKTAPEGAAPFTEPDRGRAWAVPDASVDAARPSHKA